MYIIKELELRLQELQNEKTKIDEVLSFYDVETHKTATQHQENKIVKKIVDSPHINNEHHLKKENSVETQTLNLDDQVRHNVVSIPQNINPTPPSVQRNVSIETKKFIDRNSDISKRRMTAVLEIVKSCPEESCNIQDVYNRLPNDIKPQGRMKKTAVGVFKEIIQNKGPKYNLYMFKNHVITSVSEPRKGRPRIGEISRNEQAWTFIKNYLNTQQTPRLTVQEAYNILPWELKRRGHNLIEPFLRSLEIHGEGHGLGIEHVGGTYTLNSIIYLTNRQTEAKEEIEKQTSNNTENKPANDSFTRAILKEYYDKLKSVINTRNLKAAEEKFHYTITVDENVYGYVKESINAIEESIKQKYNIEFKTEVLKKQENKRVEVA